MLLVLDVPLIDTDSTLNVYGTNLLPKIKVDSSSLVASSLYIRGFDNVGQQALGMIILPLRLGPVTFPTLVYVMPDPLPYKVLLGRP